MRRFVILILFLISFAISFAAKVDTVAIYSAAMQKSPNAVIVLPETYLNTDTLQFPVVYLLHGWSGSYKDWSRHTDLGKFSDRYRLIIICPDGGYAGWYLDSPLDSASQYETYIADEVVNFIDQHYRTIENRGGRALCGLSMGGHGAVSLLAKHPDIFSMAGSMSGVMDLRTAVNSYSISNLIGKYNDNSERWRQESCISLVKNLKGQNVDLLIDCGVDDRFIGTNRDLHQGLLDLKIDHMYIERPGGHSWQYWTNALDDHLRFFFQEFWNGKYGNREIKK